MKNGLAWFGFWICLSVFIICDTLLYYHGHETALWSHKTDAEKTIQQGQIKSAAIASQTTNSAAKEPK